MPPSGINSEIIIRLLLNVRIDKCQWILIFCLFIQCTSVTYSLLSTASATAPALYSIDSSFAIWKFENTTWPDSSECANLQNCQTRTRTCNPSYPIMHGERLTLYVHHSEPGRHNNNNKRIRDRLFHKQRRHKLLWCCVWGAPPLHSSHFRQSQSTLTVLLAVVSTNSTLETRHNHDSTTCKHKQSVPSSRSSLDADPRRQTQVSSTGLFHLQGSDSQSIGSRR